VKLSSTLARPFHDLLRGLDRVVAGGVRGIAGVFAGLILGWWIYVPVHELLHALACLATGGTVSRLEIAPLYGGRVLSEIFPFVISGGEYAGRLAGFDTGGSDLRYLAIVLGPFLLTLLPGVWALRSAARAGRGFLFGLSLPAALAPFLSLTGDAYEIGSILVTSLPPWWATETQDLLRGDDLFVKLGQVRAAGGVAAWLGMFLAALCGVVWSFGVYALGGFISDRLMSGSAPDATSPTSPGTER